MSLPSPSKPTPARSPATPAARPVPSPRAPSSWSPGRPSPASTAPSPSFKPPSRNDGPQKPTPGILSRFRTFLSGAPLGRTGLFVLLAAIVATAALAWWSARPAKPATAAVPPLASSDLPSATDVPSPAGDGVKLPSPPPPPPAPPVTPEPSAPLAAAPATPAVPLPRIPGATVTASSGGAWLVRYDDPVFVSTDRISVEGMKALKATAAALLKLPKGADVTIHGHTDDIPPSPTAAGPFRSNADLATARAEVAKEHLHVFCKRLPRYTFTVASPDSAPAPYPNDTDAHRRLNRTITLEVTPLP